MGGVRLISGRRKLITVTALAGALGVGLAGGAAPASASENVVLTLLNGITVPLLMNVPAGTPLADLKLPPEISPIVGISVTGGPDTVVAGAPATSTTLPGTGPVPVPTIPATSSVPLVAGTKAQSSTGNKLGQKVAASVFGAPGSATPAQVKPLGTPIRLSSGLPTALNPALEIAPFDAVASNVPNFFIDSFSIPDFLMPIFQAAGTEYDVPWQVLAAINQIETNFGKNLDTSSAGAEGWMQFLPATWAQYGVDANGDGVKDPFNPADAIFAAARYLHAAGASTNLSGAIFSYNRANWYVSSVLLRAKFFGGLPTSLLNSLTGLAQGDFPVAAKARYADDVAETAAAALKASETNTTLPVTASAQQTATNIYASAGSPVVAVGDGQITGLGHSPSLGTYVKMRDAYGNTYYYGGLKKLATFIPVPKPQPSTAPAVATRSATPPSDPKPSVPASAGHQTTAGAPAPAAATNVAPAPTAQATDTPSPDRLFAHPNRPADFAAGGATQAANGTPMQVSNYLTEASGFKASDLELKPLTKGSRVIAGTILGRIGVTSSVMAPHVTFMIRPAGAGSPLIDPKPVLDGWELLRATNGSTSTSSLFVRSSGLNPTIGQILLESKSQLQARVLADPDLSIYGCGRSDIASGQIDLRVLATLEYLTAEGFKPTVSTLKCGATTKNTYGMLSEHAAGDALTISAINGLPVQGATGPGSLSDMLIQQLLKLQGTFAPHLISSSMTFPGAITTQTVAGETGDIQVGFLPQYGADPKLHAAVNAALRPKQWIQLISRLGAIANPAVVATPSSSAIPDNTPSGG